MKQYDISISREQMAGLLSEESSPKVAVNSL